MISCKAFFKVEAAKDHYVHLDTHVIDIWSKRSLSIEWDHIEYKSIIYKQIAKEVS